MTSKEKVSAITLIAGAAVVANRFVTLGANGLLAPIAAQGVDSVGVALRTITSGMVTEGKDVACPVAVHDGGKLPMEAGAAIVISGGAVPVIADSLGRVIAAASDNDRILGYALEAAGAAGELITVLLVKASGQGGASASFVAAAGKHTTAGGDASETITAAGVVATDVVLVNVQTAGGTPRSIVSAVPGSGSIAVTLSGDPSTDHILAWIAFRAS